MALGTPSWWQRQRIFFFFLMAFPVHEDNTTPLFLPFHPSLEGVKKENRNKAKAQTQRHLTKFTSCLNGFKLWLSLLKGNRPMITVFTRLTVSWHF